MGRQGWRVRSFSPPSPRRPAYPSRPDQRRKRRGHRPRHSEPLLRSRSGSSVEPAGGQGRRTRCIQPPLPAGFGAGQAWGDRHEQERPPDGFAVLRLLQLERQSRHRGRGQRAHGCRERLLGRRHRWQGEFRQAADHRLPADCGPPCGQNAAGCRRMHVHQDRHQGWNAQPATRRVLRRAQDHGRRNGNALPRNLHHSRRQVPPSTKVRCSKGRMSGSSLPANTRPSNSATTRRSAWPRPERARWRAS